jgi:hypothetical protein
MLSPMKTASVNAQHVLQKFAREIHVSTSLPLSTANLDALFVGLVTYATSTKQQRQ